MRRAVVRDGDGLVLNVIEIEGNSIWPIPAGCTLVDAVTSGSPGDTWDGDQFIAPEPSPSPDYRAQWKSAVIVDEKLSIVGQILKLEDAP